MFSFRCSRARGLLLKSEGQLIESADAVWLEAHIKECEVCRAESVELTKLLDVWRDAEPPKLGTAQIERIERRVLEADLTPVSTLRPALSWRVPVAAAAAAAVLAVASLGVFWVKQRRALHPSMSAAAPSPATVNLAPPSFRTTVHRGTVSAVRSGGIGEMLRRGRAIPWNTTLQVGSRSTCVLRVGNRQRETLALASGSRVVLRRRARTLEVVLTRGTLAAEVPLASRRKLLVRLPGKGELAVVGTRFVVEAALEGAAISVLSGQVRYHWSRGGAQSTQLVRRGERMTHRGHEVIAGRGTPRVDVLALLAGGDLRPYRATPAPSQAAPVERLRPSPSLATRTCDAARVRLALRANKALEALQELEPCRRAGELTQELRSLEAEANLLAGRIRHALTGYLALAHQYPSTPEAQRALYSAGQIAARKLGHRTRARRILNHYLRQYPNGAYRANVQGLLRTL